MGVFRNRPAGYGSDNPQDAAPGRHSWYGDSYVVPVGSARSQLAEEGSYFTANNLTTATEITGHVGAAISDEPNKPLLYLYNGGQKYITIDQVFIRTEVVNNNTTDVYYVAHTTNELSRDSGGTALTVNSCRSDNAFVSAATVYFGAVVTTVSASKLIGRHLVRQTINVTEDRYHFQFGEPIVSTPAYVGTISDIYRSFPPLVVAPGGEFLFSATHPAGDTTASTFEVMLGFWER